MKYFARFRANNGNTYSAGAYEFTNKQKAVKAIRESVEANHYQQYGNRSSYVVWSEDGIIVASAVCCDNNLRWYIRHDEIGDRI